MAILAGQLSAQAAAPAKIKTIRVEKQVSPAKGKKGLKTRYYLYEIKELDTAGNLLRLSSYSPGELFSNQGVDSLKERHLFVYEQGKLRRDSLFQYTAGKPSLLSVTYHLYGDEPLPKLRGSVDAEWAPYYTKHFTDSAGRENRLVEALWEDETAVTTYAYDIQGRLIETRMKSTSEETVTTYRFTNKNHTCTVNTRSTSRLGKEQLEWQSEELRSLNKEGKVQQSQKFMQNRLQQVTLYYYDNKNRIETETITRPTTGTIQKYRYTYTEW